MTTAEKIAALENILATGVLRTTVDGVEVLFRSTDEILTWLAALRGELAAETGQSNVRTIRMGVTRGVA